MSILFSLIMPVYNNEKYFPLAVDSILTQKINDMELIIVDDGSTDLTPQIADNIAKQDKRVKIIHQKNQWIYASYTNGAKAANGEYIFLVNSDDKLRPGALALMKQKVQEYHYPDVIWTKVLPHRCDIHQNILEYDFLRWDALVQEEKYYPTQETVHNAWMYFLLSNLAQNQVNLYKKTIFLRHPPCNDFYGSDTLFNISIAREICSALVIKEPIYDFFEYQNNNMNASVGKYYENENLMFNKICTQYLHLFQDWKIPEEKYLEYICKRRLSGMTTTIGHLRASNCPLSLEEKLKRIYLVYAIDDVVQLCVEKVKAWEEFESRILSGTRELFMDQLPNENSSMYFTYELLDGLLKYEKDEADYKKIEYAINHPNNPAHIGQVFFEKMKANI